MLNTVINFKTEEKIKKEALKVAKKKGVSLDTVLNNSLKEFIRTKDVKFTELDETPNEWLIEELRKSGEDVKAGRVIVFNSRQEEIDYLNKLIEDDTRKPSTH